MTIIKSEMGRTHGLSVLHCKLRGCRKRQPLRYKNPSSHLGITQIQVSCLVIMRPILVIS